MIDDVYIGVRHVSTGGYEITTPKKIVSATTGDIYKNIEQQKIDSGEIQPEPSLVATGQCLNFRTYDPFKEKSLFRIFAALQPEDTEILNFANEFGLLGEGFSTKRGLGPNIEPLSLWKSHIDKIKFAVKLWDSIQQKDEDWLSERVIWICNKNQPITIEEVYFQGRSHKETIASRRHNETAPKWFRYGETDKPARIYLQRRINQELYNRVTNELLFKLDWSRQRNFITPKNLIGFMWLQLALTVEGNLRYKKCVVCSKPFRVEPSERGIPRRFCTDACKSKDYRNKRKGITT